MHRSSASPLPALLALTLASFGCAESIGFDDAGLAEAEEEGDDDDDGAEANGDGDPGEAGPVEHSELGGGVTLTVVDATDAEAWVYLDLDTRAAPEPDPGWELGFRRFEIIVNGGISGAEGVEVAILDGAEFEALSAAPDDAVWISDAPDGDDEDEDPDLAFVDWYDYDIATHVLTPKDRVYLVRGTEGVIFKLQISSYYSEAGSSGYLQFAWAAL